MFNLSLVRKLYNSNISKRIRNTFGIKPVQIDISHLKGQYLISDAFLWRVDNNFSTKVIFSNIPKMFLKNKKTDANIIFYNNKNKLIKKINLKDISNLNTILIDKFFFDSDENYGVFYIFYNFNSSIKDNFILSNRCYLGFSDDSYFFSYVHGNNLAKYVNVLNNSKIKTDIIQSSLVKNQNYQIQNNFEEFDKTELFFVNNTTKKINFTISKKNYSLLPGHCKIYTFKEIKVLNIVSNCMFFRPIIFNYKKNYFDVYHG